MKHLAAGDHRFLVHHAVAQAVMVYAAALISRNMTAIVLIPITTAGASGEVHLLLTPATQLAALSSDSPELDLDAAGHDALRALQAATAALIGKATAIDIDIDIDASLAFVDFDLYLPRDGAASGSIPG